MGNTWIDLPVVQALEYFSSMLVQGMKWATRYGLLFGVIGILWSGFKVMMSRMSIKDLWWDTLFKWVGFTLLLALYPAMSMGFSAIGHEVGLKVGGGNQAIIDGLKSLRTTIKADLETQQAWADGLETELETRFNNLTLNTDFQNSSSYADYLNKVSDEIDMMNFSSKKDKQKAQELVNDYKSKAKYRIMFGAQTLSVLERVLVEKELDGEKGDNLTNSYVDLDIYLRDSKGEPTSYISPSALLRLSLLCCQIMWEKENVTFNKVSDEIDANDDLGMIKKATTQLGHQLTRIPSVLMCFCCCVVLIVATIFAELQYVMTIIEYTIIVGIGAIFIPLILFDGTKDIPKKLVPVFISFLVKILVITICLMFVYYLMIENCINTIADDGGMNWTVVGEIFFLAALCYILTQNAPKIAQTILTGQPQLSMGEALAGAGTALATGAAIKQAPHAATMAAAKGKAKLNDTVGSVKKGNAAAKAAVSSLGENATAKQKRQAAFKARGAVASQGLKDRVHAKFEAAGKESGTGFSMLDKMAQQTGLTKSGGFGGTGGAGGGSSSAYGQTGQSKGGAFLNTSSNRHFATATKTDKKTGYQRSMTKKEFDAEKEAQGTNIGAKVGLAMKQEIDNQNQIKASQENKPLPENLSGGRRADS